MGEAPALSRVFRLEEPSLVMPLTEENPLLTSRVCRPQSWVPFSHWRVLCAPMTKGPTEERVLLWGFPGCQAQVGITFGTPAVNQTQLAGERHVVG